MSFLMAASASVAGGIVGGLNGNLFAPPMRGGSVHLQPSVGFMDVTGHAGATATAAARVSTASHVGGRRGQRYLSPLAAEAQTLSPQPALGASSAAGASSARNHGNNDGSRADHGAESQGNPPLRLSQIKNVTGAAAGPSAGPWQSRALASRNGGSSGAFAASQSGAGNIPAALGRPGLVAGLHGDMVRTMSDVGSSAGFDASGGGNRWSHGGVGGGTLSSRMFSEGAASAAPGAAVMAYGRATTAAGLRRQQLAGLATLHHHGEPSAGSVHVGHAAHPAAANGGMPTALQHSPYMATAHDGMPSRASARTYKLPGSESRLLVPVTADKVTGRSSIAGADPTGLVANGPAAGASATSWRVGSQAPSSIARRVARQQLSDANVDGDASAPGSASAPAASAASTEAAELKQKRTHADDLSTHSFVRPARLTGTSVPVGSPAPVLSDAYRSASTGPLAAPSTSHGTAPATTAAAAATTSAYLQRAQTAGGTLMPVVLNSPLRMAATHLDTAVAAAAVAAPSGSTAASTTQVAAAASRPSTKSVSHLGRARSESVGSHQSSDHHGGGSTGGNALSSALSAVALSAAAPPSSTHHMSTGSTGSHHRPPPPTGAEDVLALPHRAVAAVAPVAAVGAVSWRGRNPMITKINQDAVVVAEHGPTGSLLLAVFDGHGVNGREVSSFLKEQFPLVLFADRRFANPAFAVGGAAASKPSGSGPGHVRRAASSSFGAATSSTVSPRASIEDVPQAAMSASSTLCDVMADALLTSETLLVHESGINVTLSGTTAVAVVVRGSYLYIINVGDSRAIVTAAPSNVVQVSTAALLAASAASSVTGNPVPGAALAITALPPGAPITAGQRQPGPDGTLRGVTLLDPGVTSGLGSGPVLTHPSVRVKVLTFDHKPEVPRERQRILASGGRVMSTRVKGAPHIVGPARVWLKTAPLPGLNMSRSLGDLVAKQAGVISLPHRAVHALGGNDRCLVLGSDGLWDFVSNDEVGAIALSTPDTWEASARLARLARSRWLTRTGGGDDTTVVVVRFSESSGLVVAPTATQDRTQASLGRRTALHSDSSTDSEGVHISKGAVRGSGQGGSGGTTLAGLGHKAPEPSSWTQLGGTPSGTVANALRPRPPTSSPVQLPADMQAKGPARFGVR